MKIENNQVMLRALMSEDSNRIESIDAASGTKITANKISNNPLEKNTPTQKQIQIPRVFKIVIK
jgi:hypothetical protein